MATSHTRRRIERVATLGILLLASAVILFLTGVWVRPIWYDEFVYFSLGGLSGLGEAFSAVNSTTSNLNQGVTGAYMLTDFILLNAFGADVVALRLPSLLAASWMMLTGFIFLRGRGMGWWSMVAFPVVLMGQVTLMYYAGEARTYMPLASAAVGSLTYWSTLPTLRTSKSFALVGWVSAPVGALFHPYFVLYLPLVVIVGWLVTRDEWRGRWRSFLNIPLLSVTTTIYVSLAMLTWLRGTAQVEDLDPFRFLVDPVWKSIIAQVIQFIYVDRLFMIASFVLVLVAGVIAVISTSWRRVALNIVGPVALLVGSYGVALIVAGLSYSQGFWIIPRQWIASIALSSVGVVWLVFVLVEIVRVHWLRRAVGVSFMLVAILAAGGPSYHKWRQLHEWQNREPVPRSAIDDLETRLAIGEFPEDEIWIRAAQANIDSGGPVLPVFGRYYTDRDWERVFILRD